MCVCVCVCVRTDTLQQRAVVDVSTGAVAVVSGDVVDTHSVLTHLWMEAFTLIHIWQEHKQTAGLSLYKR